ncbi:MAG: hypothetical protein KDJ30_18570, partial [Rhodoblastus sp.]|nr:hypothetical protein [Rhodoblastus sp.]
HEDNEDAETVEVAERLIHRVIVHGRLDKTRPLRACGARKIKAAALSLEPPPISPDRVSRPGGIR